MFRTRATHPDSGSTALLDWNLHGNFILQVVVYHQVSRVCNVVVSPSQLAS